MAGAVDFPVNGSGDYVPGGELSIPVLPEQESLARFVAQDRALAADRLGDQEPGSALPPEHGGMELNEFHIGEQRPRAERDRNPLPGRHRGIRALAVEAPRPAGREHDGTGVRLLDVASRPRPT